MIHYVIKFLAPILKITFIQKTKLSNEELKNWKLSVKINLLLMSKAIYFSNPFGMTFILKLIFSNS